MWRYITKPQFACRQCSQHWAQFKQNEDREEISTISASDKMEFFCAENVCLRFQFSSMVKLIQFPLQIFDYYQVFWLGSFNKEGFARPFQMGFLISSIGISVWSPTSYKWFLDLPTTFYQHKKEFLNYLKNWLFYGWFSENRVSLGYTPLGPTLGAKIWFIS